MRKILIQLLLLVSIATYGQRINDVFHNMPTQLLPGISEANKTRLLADTINASVPYILGEITKLQHTDNLLKIRTSAIGTTQIKLLPIRRTMRRNAMIIGVIQTVCGRACSSHISFYTINWERLDASAFLPDISVKNFLDSSQKGSENYKYAVSLSDILPVSAQFNENNTDITLTLNYRQQISDIAIAEITPFLKTDTIVLQWYNGSFR